MYQCKAVRTILTVALLIRFASAVQATPDYLTRPGTIAHALTQSDGTCVSLDAVKVDKIKARQNPCYFVIAEDWDATKRLVVNAEPPEALRMGQTVDVQGELTTLPSGERALTDVSITGYCDSDGTLLRRPPIMKGMLEPVSWPYKVQLTIPSSRSGSSAMEPIPGEPNSEALPPPAKYSSIAELITANPDDGTAAQLGCKPIVCSGTDSTYGPYFILGEDASTETLKIYSPTIPSPGARLYDVMGQVRSEGQSRVICTTSGPDYDPQSYEGYASLAADGTIARLKTRQDGDPVSLAGKVVTEVFYERGTQNVQFFYIQEQLGTLGSDGLRHDYKAIKVARAGAAVHPGDVVSIGGHIRTTQALFSRHRECYVDADSVTVTGAVAVPPPVGMSQRTTAGGSYGLQPALYPDTTPTLPPAGSGPDRVGMRTKVWGKVLSGGLDDGPYVYHIDDGSSLHPDSQHTGLKVICWSGVQMIGWQTGQFVEATGILGAEEGGGGLPVPVLRVDSTPPTAPMVTDDGTHTASTNQLHASWTAQDAESGIARYDYGIGTATYPSTGWDSICGWTFAGTDTEITSTHSFANNATYYISVRATNGTGLTSVGASNGIAVDTNAPAISEITVSESETAQYEKYEAAFTIKTKGETTPGAEAFSTDADGYNPFNPNLDALTSKYYDLRGMQVDALLTPPGQSTASIVWPCYWHEDFNGTYTTKTWSGWKFRFAPTVKGLWNYRIRVRFGYENAAPKYDIETPDEEFTCVDPLSDNHGFVKVTESDGTHRRFFQFSDGSLLYPIGTNISGMTGSLVDVPTAAFADMHDNGANFSRVHLTSLAIERSCNGLSRYTLNNYQKSETGDLGLTRAARIDKDVQAARDNNIYLEWVVDDWTGIGDSSQNPYVRYTSGSTTREGPCTTTSGFFSLDAAKEIYKRKLRYIMARWGYSVNLMAIELINEIDVGGTEKETWHNEMCDYIHNFGAQPHLASSSNGSAWLRSGHGINWSSSSVDFVNFHDYAKYTSQWPYLEETIANYTFADDQLGIYDASGGPWPDPDVRDTCPNYKYPWIDTAVWVDRIARVYHRRYGWNKPLIWSEFGLIYRDCNSSSFPDWDAVYEIDTTAQHLRNAIWAGMFSFCTVSHWKLDYMRGYGFYSPGGPKYWVLRPLSNFIEGEDFSNLSQETTYPVTDPLNTSPNVKCFLQGTTTPHTEVMVMALRGSTAAYLYVKNLTNAWAKYVEQSEPTYDIAPTPASKTATVKVYGLTEGSYTLEKWSTIETDKQQQVLFSSPVSVGSDGIATFDVAGLTEDFAYKLK